MVEWVMDILEYDALLTGCGMLAVNNQEKIAVVGDDAAGFLNGIFSNDILSLQAGQGCEAAYLTPKGKMLGIIRILASQNDQTKVFLLDTDSVSLVSLEEIFQQYQVGYKVKVIKQTSKLKSLSLIGPATDTVLRQSLDEGTGLPHIAVFSHEIIQINGIETRLVRTRWGLELLFREEDNNKLLDYLTMNIGVVPVQEETWNVLRVERGLPLYGPDLDDTVIPQEAGLNERLVSFTKGCYVGQETIARLYYKGKPNRHFRGLKLSASASYGDEIYVGDKKVGALTSVVSSPRFGEIALGFIRAEVIGGQEVAVDGAKATVIELPFS